MASKIITNGRLEYLEDTIDVTYPDIGKVTYRGSRPLIVSNQWAPPVKMPVKGDIIKLGSFRYLVLNTNETVVEVLYSAIGDYYGYPPMRYYGTGASDERIYSDSNVNKQCKSWYDRLNNDIKNAVIPKTFKQELWSTTGDIIYTGINKKGESYTLARTGFGDEITANAYALSISDILAYLEVTPDMTADNTTLTATNLNNIINNGRSATSQFLSSVFGSPLYPAYIDIDLGGFGSKSGRINADSVYDPITDGIVNPAFQIDLSKVEWTKV